MGKTYRGKEKLRAKIKAAKAKLARKVKTAALVAKTVLAAFSLAVVCGGCAEAYPASRATTASYDIDVRVSVDEGVRSTTVNIPFTFGDGALASADSSGSTETQTATPTTDVKPDVDVSVPVNKAGAAQTLGSTLGDAAAALINGVGSGSSASANKNNGGCADGSCSYSAGGCADGSCSP